MDFFITGLMAVLMPFLLDLSSVGHIDSLGLQLNFSGANVYGYKVQKLDKPSSISVKDVFFSSETDAYYPVKPNMFFESKIPLSDKVYFAANFGYEAFLDRLSVATQSNTATKPIIYSLDFQQKTSKNLKLGYKFSDRYDIYGGLGVLGVVYGSEDESVYTDRNVPVISFGTNIKVSSKAYANFEIYYYSVDVRGIAIYSNDFKVNSLKLRFGFVYDIRGYKNKDSGKREDTYNDIIIEERFDDLKKYLEIQKLKEDKKPSTPTKLKYNDVDSTEKKRKRRGNSPADGGVKEESNLTTIDVPASPVPVNTVNSSLSTPDNGTSDNGSLAAETANQSTTNTTDVSSNNN